MFNPFFDPSSLTDKELQAKINEQSDRITQARSAGMPHNMIQSMYQVLQACDEEVMMRHARRELEQTRDEDSCVFDTESYLKSEEDKKTKNESPRKQIYKSGW